MGNWVVASVTGQLTDYDTIERFGNLFKVTIRLRHEASFADRSPYPPPFTDPPKLEWNERITIKDEKEKKYSDWYGDKYAFRPTAKTFSPWRQRYVEAYRRAAGAPTSFETLNGSSELRVNGVPVTADRLLALPGAPGEPVVHTRPPADDWGKAEAVRRFIQKNSCELIVEILDRPYLQLPRQGMTERMTERLLLFDCGAGGRRVKAYQRLRVNGDTRQRSSGRSWTQYSMDTKGFRYEREDQDLRLGEDLWFMHYDNVRKGEFL